MTYHQTSLIAPCTIRGRHTVLAHRDFREPKQLDLQCLTHAKTARTYFLKNSLKLNAKKTQCIFLGTRQIIPKTPENTTLKFHDTTIKSSSRVKNLGVHFDNYMTFETHVNEMSEKVMGTLMYIQNKALC